MARAHLRKRRRGGRASANRKGLEHAAIQQQMTEKIEAAKPGGAGQRRMNRRRLDLGRPRHRLYPQAGLLAKQRHGLAPIPTVVGNVLDDDDGTE
jgi:hypothetical protein